MNRTINFLMLAMAVFLTLSVNAHAELIFFDDFEYSVGREDADANTIFINTGGWSYVKTQQSYGSGKGYLYTSTSIPGFDGSFPGTSSSRVLVIEALPETMEGQTDFYLQLGEGQSSEYDDYIPGDVWFQFWAYPNYYGDQLSRWRSDDKFFYMCNTSYPCHSHTWMLCNGPSSWNPNMGDNPLGHPSDGEFNWLLRNAVGVSNINYSLVESGEDMCGPTDSTEWMKPNRWTLVKLHMNTSSTSGNSFEAWLKPYGGEWTKVSEWIGGVTPNFTWTIPSGSEGGHRVLRMPTTVGSTPAKAEWYDSWLYIDDFAVASSEQDLPTYSDYSGLTEPQNLRLIEQP